MLLGLPAAALPGIGYHRPGRLDRRIGSIAAPPRSWRDLYSLFSRWAAQDTTGPGVKRLGEDEALVALRRDLRTSVAIAADALGTEIRQKRARFPWDVGAHPPGIAERSSVPLTTSLTCATQLSWAAGTASTVVSPSLRIYAMQSAIHSTCCSIATGIFASTDGLCGPVIVNRLGKLATESPREVRGPSAQASFSARPPQPLMFR